MLIVFHTHAFPDKLAGKTLPMLSKTSGGAPYYTDGYRKRHPGKIGRMGSGSGGSAPYRYPGRTAADNQ